MPAGWAFRVSSGCTTSARPLARTCLVTGELWVAQGSQDSKLEREKGAECSVTGEPGNGRRLYKVLVVLVLSVGLR